MFSPMIDLLIWLVCAVLIGVAVMGVVRAVMRTLPFRPYADAGNVVIALVWLIIVLVLVEAVYTGRPFPLLPVRR